MASGDTRKELANLVLDKLRREFHSSPLLWNSDHGSVSTHRPLACDGLAFRGSSRLRLTLQSIESQFKSPFWFTMEQAEKLGAELRAKQQGTILHLCRLGAESPKSTTYARIEMCRFLETTSVLFNADQFERLPLRYQAANCDQYDRFGLTDAGRQFFASIQADVEYQQGNGYYDHVKDRIRMPIRHEFVDDDCFVFAFLHQHVHWTGHRTRLDRSLECTKFGNAEYAFEELIAELGTAFLCSELSIRPTILNDEDRVGCLQFWLEQLKRDERAIYIAADLASDAVEYLSYFQPQTLCAC